MIVLDTHALIWLATGSEQLGKISTTLAQEACNQGLLAVSAISFWELSMLYAKKRELTTGPFEMRNILLRTGLVEIPP